MPPAVAAGVGAAASIGGALIGANASNKANKAAIKAQKSAQKDQTSLSQAALSLNSNIYQSNKDLLNPFVARGNVAGDAINSLLGLPQAPGTVAGTGQSAPLTGEPLWAKNALAAILPHVGPERTAKAMAILDPVERLTYLQAVLHPDEKKIFDQWVAQNPRPAQPQTPSGVQTNPGAPIPGSNQTQPAQNSATPSSTPLSTPPAYNAFQNFANSAGMQFQIDQGTKAIQNSALGNGSLQSGAAMKALQGYGQQTALNNYFMPYMGLLSGQQGTGAQAGSAVAGVGSNFGSTAAGILGNQGQAAQNFGNAASNSALLGGQIQNNMWNQIGGALGGLASSFGRR